MYIPGIFEGAIVTIEWVGHKQLKQPVQSTGVSVGLNSSNSSSSSTGTLIIDYLHTEISVIQVAQSDMVSGVTSSSTLVINGSRNDLISST